jgi:hypothetical protein
MIGTAIVGFLSGDVKKQMVSKVFDFDPKSNEPIEHLIVESLFNGLAREDIEEIFRRYAKYKGLDF